MRARYLLASDTHMRSRRGDEQYALVQIVDAAIRNKVEAVVLAGDLFDKQSNRSASVVDFNRQIDRLEEAEIGVYFTQGQHDWDSPAWLSGHRWAQHIHKELAYNEADDCPTLYGLDWQPFGQLQQELAQIPPETEVLVCHQVWADWMGDVANPQGSFSQVPGHIKVVYTGDLHQKKHEYRKNADGEKMLVVSTGATCQQKSDEPTEHYYALMYDDHTVKHFKLKSRVVIDAGLLTRPDEVDKLIAEGGEKIAVALQTAAAGDYPPEISKPILKFHYNAKLHDAERRVRKAFGELCHVHCIERIPEEKLEAYKKSKVAAEGEAVTPLSVLPDEVDKTEDPAVYELVSRMLVAQDKEAEFAKWRAEQLGDIPQPETEE